jgi:hypothetical protein
LNKYSLVAKAYTGGAISPAGTFVVTHGDSKTFDIIPNANYKIKDVVVDGISEGALETYTFHFLNANGKIEAYFEYEVGINDPDATINIFSHNNIVTILNEQLVPIKQVEIMDMYGRIIWTGTAPEARTEIALNVAKGMYGVRVVTGDEQSVMVKVVIW